MVFGEVWKSGPSGSNDKMLLQSLVVTLVAWGCSRLLETDIKIFEVVLGWNRMAIWMCTDWSWESEEIPYTRFDLQEFFDPDMEAAVGVSLFGRYFINQ